MRLLPIFKTLFGYAQMTNAPLFPGLEFVMFDLVKLQIERGECEADQLNWVKPGVNKNDNTMFCFPTPRKQDKVSESQLARAQFIVEHSNRLTKTIKDFLLKLRRASNSVFPLDFPIEKCIGNPSIVIPYEDDSGIYVVFDFSDWGACIGVMVIFRDWDDIQEVDINEYPRLLGKRGSGMD